MKAVLRWLKRGLLTFFVLLVLYALLGVIGLIPANSNFVESPEAEGVRIYVFSSAVHSDVILPVRTPEQDWQEVFPPGDFQGDVASEPFVSIGWGDAGFFREVPTWSDLTFPVGFKAAFLPSPSLLRVQYHGEPDPDDCLRSVVISHDAHARLVAEILKSRPPDSKPQGLSYLKTDAFYSANGSYHALDTCNNWVADVLEVAGVKVPFYCPFGKAVLLYLPRLTN